MLLLKYISLICLVALPILYTASWVGIISPPKFISPAKFIELAVIFTFDISPLSIFTFEINWLFAFIAPPNVEIVISPFTVTPVKFPLTMFTFENAWVLQSIAPNNFEISISDIVPPPITSPVNWFGANTIFAALKSIVEPEINSILFIVPPIPLIIPPLKLTLLINWLQKSIGPWISDIVILSIVPPFILSPLIWLSLNNNIPALISMIELLLIPIISLLLIKIKSLDIVVDFIIPPLTFILLIIWLLQSIGPPNDAILISSIVPLFILSPLIWSSLNNNVPPLISITELLLIPIISLLLIISELLDIVIEFIIPPLIFTLDIFWLLQSIEPPNFDILISSIVPPCIASPLIWLSFNTNVAALISIILLSVNTISHLTIDKLSNAPLFICIFFNNWLLQSNGPVNLFIVISSIVPPYIALPLICLSLNIIEPKLISKVLPLPIFILPSCI